MKKTLIIITAVIACIIVAIAGLILAYTRSSDYTADHLPQKTSINGVDCSNLTYDEAFSQLSDEWNKKTLTVVGSLNDKLAEFTHFDCGDIKYETYAGVVAILQEEAVLNNWMRVTFYKTRESYDIINRYLIKARSYVYNNENVSKNLNEEINGVDVLIRGGDKKKEDDYVMSASWTANGFNYVVYAEKYVHMDELKQLVVDVMESEEYKAGK